MHVAKRPRFSARTWLPSPKGDFHLTRFPGPGAAIAPAPAESASRMQLLTLATSAGSGATEIAGTRREQPQGWKGEKKEKKRRKNRRKRTRPTQSSTLSFKASRCFVLLKKNPHTSLLVRRRRVPRPGLCDITTNPK